MRILILLFLGLSSCALFDKLPDKNQDSIMKKSYQRVFYANYDNVWRSAHSSLKYAFAQTNQDTGHLETEYIKGIDGFLAPEAPPALQGLRYKIVMTFVKGKSDGRESTRVTIEKRIEILRDFFSDPVPVQSDGLEEKQIFYRIERELIISEALKKAGG